MPHPHIWVRVCFDTMFSSMFHQPASASRVHGGEETSSCMSPLRTRSTYGMYVGDLRSTSPLTIIFPALTKKFIRMTVSPQKNHCPNGLLRAMFSKCTFINLRCLCWSHNDLPAVRLLLRNAKSLQSPLLQRMNRCLRFGVFWVCRCSVFYFCLITFLSTELWSHFAKR